MSKIVSRTRRDLDEIADRAPISPAARDSILARVAEPIDHSEREVVMLNKNTFTTPRRTWGIPVAIGIAAVAALAVAGIVIIRSGGDDDQVATVAPAPAIVDDEPTGADETPVADEPAETPVADEPAEVEQPAADPSVTDEPLDDASATADEPAVDEPAADQPIADGQPTVDHLEQVIALPWSGADDAHPTPQEAVDTVLDFMTWWSVLPDSALYAELTLGDYVETGEDVGVITVTGTEEAFHDVGEFLMPTSTIALRQVDGHWWVTGATSETISVDEPTPGSVFGPPMAVSGENGLFSNALQLHVYVDGGSEPLAATFFTGGGVFAWGDFDMTFDPANPEPCVEGRCWDTPDWEVPVGEPGTLVITDNARIVTIPITFGE